MIEENDAMFLRAGRLNEEATTQCKQQVAYELQ
jgi:hypothetical protein